MNQNQNQTKKNMKATLSTSQAAEILINDDYANWSHAGAYAIVRHLEELEESIGEELQFDPVAIRCDFSEYKSLQEWGECHFGGWNKLCNELGDDYCGPFEDETPEEYADRFDDAIRQYIQDRGELIEFDGGIIVRDF